MTGSAGAPSARRAIGQRAGLTRQRIVEAAREFDAQTLTFQAVADRLGVDRKAVRHHVSDLPTLLNLMALDAVAERAAEVTIPDDATWQEAAHLYARALADTVIAADRLAGHLASSEPLPGMFGAATEALSRKLTEAGFDDEAALRFLALLSNVCLAYAQDVAAISGGAERPRRVLAQQAITGHESEYENFARLVARQVDTYDRRQLEIAVEILLRGMVSLFPPRDAA